MHGTSGQLGFLHPLKGELLTLQCPTGLKKGLPDPFPLWATLSNTAKVMVRAI